MLAEVDIGSYTISRSGYVDDADSPLLAKIDDKLAFVHGRSSAECSGVSVRYVGRVRRQIIWDRWQPNFHLSKDR